MNWVCSERTCSECTALEILCGRSGYLCDRSIRNSRGTNFRKAWNAEISNRGTEILLYYGKPSPYQTNQEIYFDFIPTGSYIDSGVWQIVLTPRKVVTGIYQMWLPSERILNRGTAFLNPVSSDYAYDSIDSIQSDHGRSI